MNEMTARGLPGCELAVSVKGKTVYRKSAGFVDTEKTRETSANDIYWIFSCTKVITCLATMRLVEEGKISLSDPVSKYIPEYAELKIKNAETGEISDATRTMTVEHLFTMCGGMDYYTQSPEITGSIKEGKTSTLDLVKAMAKTPLGFEPGTHFRYSLCHDVLAGIIEVVSGMRFSEYLEKYFFAPLGIKNMGFRPSEEQKARFVAQYLYHSGTNTVTPHPIGNPYALSHEYDSGGAGLFSTVDDYMKIITVIANGGTTEDGYSLLRPETIRMLTENRLIPDAINDFVDTRLYGYGWGLCGRVHMNQTISLSKSPVGEFGWDGAAGAFTMIDIENGVALYFGTSVFSARYVYNVIHPTIRNLVYEALETE